MDRSTFTKDTTPPGPIFEARLLNDEEYVTIKRQGFRDISRRAGCQRRHSRHRHRYFGYLASFEDRSLRSALSCGTCGSRLVDASRRVTPGKNACRAASI
ncbi:unnamed protein product [Ectocarpus sp. 12 AP-2014]